MAREKPLDLDIAQAWLDAWDDGNPFSEPAVHHLQSLLADSHCLLAVTLNVGGEPRSLVFRRRRYVLPAVLGRGPPIIVPNASGLARTGRSAPAQDVPSDRSHVLTFGWHIRMSRKMSMIAGPAAPAAPRVGQLWHQTGVKLEKVLRWDGADWVIAGHVIDSPSIMMQGQRACHFSEALARAHWHATQLDCEFIYTYDGSAWGHA
jgi:hypothetical protein